MEDREMMELALALARQSAAEGEVPVGCVVTLGDRVVGRGRNRREHGKNALLHAEIEAIDEACRTLGGWRLWQCTLCVTLEPCPMCAGAIINARIPRVIYGAKDPKNGCGGSVIDLFLLPFNHRPELVGGVLEAECAQLLSDFFGGLRERRQREDAAEELLERLVSIVRNAGRLIPSDPHAELAVSEKSGPRDLVTKYDALVQSRLQQELLALLPQAGFMGEEGFHAEDWRSYEWLFIVDPIDGTTNFIQGIPNSSVSVGLMHRGRIEYGVVYNPFTHELYSARRGGGSFLNGRRLRASDRPLCHSLLLFGSAVYYPELIEKTKRLFSLSFPLAQDVRRFGSAALDLCELAAGRAGAFFESRLCPWDYAAGSLVAEEAGVKVTKLDGSALDFFARGSLLAGTPLCWEELYRLFAEEGSPDDG